MTAMTASEDGISVDDVFAMEDAELGLFLQKHRQPDGTCQPPIHGWFNLCKEESDHLAEKLNRAQIQAHRSLPLDLDDLDARLQRIPPDNHLSPRPQPQAEPQATDPVFSQREQTPLLPCLEHDTEAYHDLVNDGGRPAYSIAQIHDVYREPESFTHLLHPWQEFIGSASHEYIIVRQLDRWRDFRKWQNDNRNLDDDDGGFPAFVERQKARILRKWLPEAAAEKVAKIEADQEYLRPQWEDAQWERRNQRARCREQGCNGFYEYEEAVKRRLASHEFIQPFKLDQDSKNQDQLTTWIEYLNYECWWLDKYIKRIERQEADNEKAWRELVDKKILRPHETQEFVRDRVAMFERMADRDEAQEALKIAEYEEERTKKSKTIKDQNGPSISDAEQSSILREATAKVQRAKRRLDDVKSRIAHIGTFLSRTSGYDLATSYANSHRLLVQWASGQVPLIQAEMAQGEANRVRSGEAWTMKRKHCCDEEEEADTSRTPKRPRGLEGAQSSGPARSDKSAVVLPKASQTEPTPRARGRRKPKAAPDSPTDGSLEQSASHARRLPPREPRRSARITQRRVAAEKTEESTSWRERLRPRPKPAPAQPSAEENGRASKAKRTSKVAAQWDEANPNRMSQGRRQRKRT